MTRLFVHGLGSCALGEDAAFAPGLGEMADVPIKDYASANARRRYGRLAKLMYVAASRALSDAAVADPTQIAIVAGTAMGELRSSLELVVQIRATNGAQVSPALVPNSVHNSPAGHLTIGLKNRCPSITVSGGWLSAEAALAAAADLLALSGLSTALVVVGDEVDATWAKRLLDAGAPDLEAALAGVALQEGAIALVVGTMPGPRALGSLRASVERSNDVAARARSFVEEIAATSGERPNVRLRCGAGGERLRAAVGGEIVEGGAGTSNVGALLELVRLVRGSGPANALILGTEIDDVGYIHYAR